MSFEFLYKHSRADARELDELERWRLSYNANCECKEAIEKAYAFVEKVHFDNAFYRKDIGQKALAALNK